VPTEYVDEAIERIEQKLLSLGEREIESRRIGELVMKELYKLDKVAYIRFASVYKSFEDVEDFRDVIEQVRRKKPQKRVS
jgi:transcriptional repressor NrdR